MRAMKQKDSKWACFFLAPFATALFMVYYFLAYGYRQQQNILLNLVMEEPIFEIRFKNNIDLKYRMLFGQPCSSEIKILFLSMTRRDAFRRRNAIRQTWMGPDSHSNSTIRFLVADAQKDENPNVQQQMDEEQALYGDLVFIKGFNDSYFHIHFKWFAGLQWQQTYCPNTHFVVKADDDSVINVDRLNYWIDHKFQPVLDKTPLAYFGLILSGKPVIRNNQSKWYVSEEEYSGYGWPPFALGCVYLTTAATISAILPHSKEVPGFHLDDVVFTALMADLANVTRFHHPEHFAPNFDEKNVNCENGEPTHIALWGVGDHVPSYEHEYKKLRTIKCPSTGNTTLSKS